MTVFFTADLHFGHTKLFEVYQPNRHPLGSTVEEMNEAIIDHWNARVGPKDLVYFLGDLTLNSHPEIVVPWLNRLNGNIRIVAGNHDVWIARTEKRGLMPNHVTVIANDRSMKRIRLEGKSMILSHYPIEDWPGRSARSGRSFEDYHTGRYHLHGHSHGRSNFIPGRLDVGWDAHDRILSWDEVRYTIDNQQEQ